MTEELGEERWESFKTSMNGRGTRRSAGVGAKQRKGWHREEEDEVRQRSLELRQNWVLFRLHCMKLPLL